MSSPTATLISRLGGSWGRSGRDRQGAPAAMAASGRQEQAGGPAVGQGRPGHVVPPAPPGWWRSLSPGHPREAECPHLVAGCDTTAAHTCDVLGTAPSPPAAQRTVPWSHGDWRVPLPSQRTRKPSSCKWSRCRESARRGRPPGHGAASLPRGPPRPGSFCLPPGCRERALWATQGRGGGAGAAGTAGPPA